VLPSLSGPQILTLAYLGIIATGLGFFWWNIGATRVDTGVLAAANNAKIPLAVLVSIFVFSSQAKLLPTLTGLAVVVVAMLIPRMLPFTPHGKRPEESEERA
jgi:drug/metabolite transporter (DMT)-like permease